MRSKTVYLLVIFGLFLSSACGKKVVQSVVNTPNQGGQDVGGGNTQRSTPEEVELTIKNGLVDVAIILDGYLALSEGVGTLTNSMIGKVKHLGTPVLGKHQNEVNKIKLDILKKIRSIKLEKYVTPEVQDRIDLLDEEEFEKSEKSYELSKKLLNYFEGINKESKTVMFASSDKEERRKSFFERQDKSIIKIRNILQVPNLILKTEGNCLAKDNHTPDATVSSYSVNTNLCFSIRLLQNIPPSELKMQVIALIVHELLHMLGYEEDVAKLIQRDFLIYFSLSSWGNPNSLSNQILALIFKNFSEMDIYIYATTNKFDDYVKDYTDSEFFKEFLKEFKLSGNESYSQFFWEKYGVNCSYDVGREVARIENSMNAVGYFQYNLERYNQNANVLDFLNINAQDLVKLSKNYLNYRYEILNALKKSCEDINSAAVNIERYEEIKSQIKIYADKVLENLKVEQ